MGPLGRRSNVAACAAKVALAQPVAPAGIAVRRSIHFHPPSTEPATQGPALRRVAPASGGRFEAYASAGIQLASHAGETSSAAAHRTVISRASLTESAGHISNYSWPLRGVS